MRIASARRRPAGTTVVRSGRCPQKMRTGKRRLTRAVAVGMTPCKRSVTLR